jgi:hypothetical protein
MPGCLLENSQTYSNDVEKKHIDEKVDAAAPYILKGALVVFCLFQIIRIFIKK